MAEDTPTSPVDIDIAPEGFGLAPAQPVDIDIAPEGFGLPAQQPAALVQAQPQPQPVDIDIAPEGFDAAPTTVGAGAHLDTPLLEQEAAYKYATWLGSGEFFRGPPSRLTGQTRAHRLMAASRGNVPASGEMPGESWAGGIWQFGLNILAGAAGIVGSKFTFPLMSAMAATREIVEETGRRAAIARHGDDPQRENVFGGVGGYSSQAAIQKELSTGNLSAASHRARMARRAEAGVKMTLESMSLPIAAALHAPPGDKVEAAWEAFYTYPIESIIGPAAILKGGARAGIGGKAVPVPAKIVVGKPSLIEGITKAGARRFINEPLKVISEISQTRGDEIVLKNMLSDDPIVHQLPPRKTIFGAKGPRDLELAPWAHKLFYRTPNWMKPIVWDTMTPADQARASWLREFKSTSSTKDVRESANRLFNSEKWLSFKNELKNISREMGTELSDTQLDVLSFNAIQGVLFRVKKTGDVDFSFGEGVARANKMLEQWPREARSVIPATMEDYKSLARVGRSLQKLGLDRDQIDLTMSYIMRMVPDIVASEGPTPLTGIPMEVIRVVSGQEGPTRELTKAGKAVSKKKKPASAERAARKSGVVADGHVQFASPSDLYKHISSSIDNITKAAGGVEALQLSLTNLTNKMANDPNWVAYMNTPKSVAGNTWIPSSPISGGSAAIEAAAPGIRAFTALSELEGKYPRKKMYGVPVTKRGRLVADVKLNRYQKILSDIVNNFADADSQQRRIELVTALFNSRPILRLRSGPKSNPLVEFLSEQMINPESALYELGSIFQSQQQQLPKLLGIEPVALMNKSNLYVTRVWNDLTENQMRIQRDLDNEIFGIGLQKTPPRHGRKLSELESQKRYLGMLVDDPTGFNSELVVKFSIDQTQQLVENLRYFDELHSWIEGQGIDMSKPRPGFEQVPTLLDVDPKLAHANDPYNWMFGRMAGKYVPKELASSLKLARDAYAKSPPIISYWKLVHTAFNLPGYQVRNELGDLLNVAAASGHNPMSKVWRRARAETFKEMDAYYSRNTSSKDIDAAISRGVMSEKGAGGAPMVTGDVVSVGTSVLQRMSPGLDPTPQSINTTVQTLFNLINFGDFAKGSWQKWGVSLSKKKGEKGIKLGTAWKKVRDAWVDSKARKVKGGHVWAHGQNAIRELNKELSSGIIVEWTVQQENRRRLFAYKMGKRMGLDDAGAAKWALDTLHDYGDRPGWLKTVQTAGPLPYLTPPFSTYFYKQSVFQMRQALNNPELFVSWMLLNGMDAYDEQYRADQDKVIGGEPMRGASAQSEVDFLSRLQFANYASYGAAHKVLGSGRDVANALQDLGWKGGKGTIVNAIEGWDERGNLHELTYMLPLKDIANLSNMLVEFQPNETIERRMSRLSPFVDLWYVFMNPETLSSPSTGEMVHPSEPGVSHKAYRTLQQMVHTFTPWQSWNSRGPASLLTGRTGKALASAAEGELYTVGRKGYPVDPLSALSKTLTPGLGISAISQINVWRRLRNKYDSRKRKISREHAMYKYKLTPFREEDAVVESRTEAMFKVHLYMNGLQMAYSMGDITQKEFRDGRRELMDEWKLIEKSFKSGDKVMESDLGTSTSQIIMQSLMDAVSWVYEGEEGEEALE